MTKSFCSRCQCFRRSPLHPAADPSLTSWSPCSPLRSMRDPVLLQVSIIQCIQFNVNQSSHFHAIDLLNLQECSSPQDNHLPTPPSLPQHSSSSTSLCSAPPPWVSFPLLVSGPESNNRAPTNYLVSWFTLLIIIITTMLSKIMITNMISMLRSASSPHRGEEATTAEPQVERSRDDCCATAHHRIQVKFFTRFLVF